MTYFQIKFDKWPGKQYCDEFKLEDKKKEKKVEESLLVPKNSIYLRSEDEETILMSFRTSFV